MDFVSDFLDNSIETLKHLDKNSIESVVDLLVAVRKNDGRIFIIGSGGGAGHASHAVCDFRKLCGFEAYSPSDNVSELTARINDDGWDTSIVNYLKGSRFNDKDCVFVFSVGGGNAAKNISTNLVNAIQYAKECGGKVTGVVGRDGGETKKMGDAVVVIPSLAANNVTPITESFQALVWHLVVSHPKLQVNQAKWESTQ